MFKGFKNITAGDLLKKPYKIVDNIEVCEPIAFFQYPNDSIEKIIIRRDKSYNLEAVITGSTNESDLIIDNTLRGAAFSAGQVTGMIGSYAVLLEECVIVNDDHEKSHDSKDIVYEVLVSVERITIKNEKFDIPNKCLIEWFINGPNKEPLFNEELIMFRDGDTPVTYNYKQYYKNDNINVVTDDFNITLQKLELTNIENSRHLSIKYTPVLDIIPDSDIREKVSEFISFVLGRNLIGLGHTIVDESDNLIEAVIKQPYSYNLLIENGSDNNSILPFVYGKVDLSFDEIIKKLLPAYVENAKNFNLSYAIEMFWIANTMPLGAGLPIISSGLETIINNWFKNEKSKSHGFYMDKEIFEKKISPIIETAEQVFDEEDCKDNIINRIKYSNNAGFNKKFDIFFNELGLKISNNESKAIKDRSRYAHGSQGRSDDTEDLYISKVAYNVLFYRVVLRILGYDGDYANIMIDGFPLVNIDDVIEN